jgi:hypothetical protein
MEQNNAYTLRYKILYLFRGVESAYKYLLLYFLFRHSADEYVQTLDRQILRVLREIMTRNVVREPIPRIYSCLKRALLYFNSNIKDVLLLLSLSLSSSSSSSYLLKCA